MFCLFEVRRLFEGGLSKLVGLGAALIRGAAFVRNAALIRGFTVNALVFSKKEQMLNT